MDYKLIEIAEKFYAHLESLERLLKYSTSLRDEFHNEDKEEPDFNVLVDVLLDVKKLELKKDVEDLTDDEKEKLDMAYEGMKNNDFIDFFYKNFEMISVDGDAQITFKSPLVEKYILERLKEYDAYHNDITQLKNSIVISLVTSMELLIGELFKDFVENIDQSGFLDKRSINFKDLAKIEDISQARRFLLDQYVEEILRSSFVDWIKELKERMKIDLTRLEILKVNNDLSLINETFQRRHLFIHNDGIVNDLYLTKVDTEAISEFKKDDKIINDEKYIVDRIALFKKVGNILLYMYSKKKYRSDLNQYFQQFNNLLLNESNNGCLGARYIYKELSSNSDLSHSNQLVSLFNYYLGLKINDEFEDVRYELEKFTTETLSVEYRLAKNILIDNHEDAVLNFEVFMNSITDGDFLHYIDWPLIKLIKHDDRVSGYISDRMGKILTKEGSV